MCSQIPSVRLEAMDDCTVVHLFTCSSEIDKCNESVKRSVRTPRSPPQLPPIAPRPIKLKNISPNSTILKETERAMLVN